MKKIFTVSLLLATCLTSFVFASTGSQKCVPAHMQPPRATGYGCESAYDGSSDDPQCLPTENRSCGGTGYEALVKGECRDGGTKDCRMNLISTFNTRQGGFHCERHTYTHECACKFFIFQPLPQNPVTVSGDDCSER